MTVDNLDGKGTEAMQDRLEEMDLELEVQVKEAFDSVRLPEDVRMRTYAAITSAHQNKHAPLTSKAPRSVRSKRRLQRFAYGVAACLVLSLVGYFGVSYVAVPTAYIDVDVNPSIELAVNRFDHVVGIEAINDDGEEIFGETAVIGMPSTEAVEELMKDISEAGYNLNDSFLEVSVLSDNAEQAISLESDINALMTECGYSGSCNVVDESVREAAHHSNMGVGKYLSVQELLKVDSSMTMDECSHMSMRQIRNLIDAHGEHIEEGSDQADASQDEADTGSRGASGAGRRNGDSSDGGNHGHHGMNHNE